MSDPISVVRRHYRKVKKRFKNWKTIVDFTLEGNQIEKKANLWRAKQPVLLLYGFIATRRTLAILEKRLSQAGYTVFSLNLGGLWGKYNTGAIEELASLVDQKIERIYKKYQITAKLSIISHSKGGLIGAYYVKRLHGDRRVKTLITLGTPHHGNPWALVGSVTPLALTSKSLRQMTPMSPFIQRLQRGPFPKKVQLYSVYSQDDRVCPYPNAVLKTSSNVFNIEVRGVSHSEFLIKKNVFYIIEHALSNCLPKSLTAQFSSPKKAQQKDPNRVTKARRKIFEQAKKLTLRK